MSYDVQNVLNSLQAAVHDGYDIFSEALQSTGRIVPFISLDKTIRDSMDHYHPLLNFNTWIPMPFSKPTNYWGFNVPILTYEMPYRFDEIDGGWVFRVFFPFEPTKFTPNNFPKAVSEERTFFTSPDSSLNERLFDWCEKSVEDFFDEDGEGHGSDIFQAYDGSFGVEEYQDEIDYIDISQNLPNEIKGKTITTQVFVRKSWKKVDRTMPLWGEEKAYIQRFADYDSPYWMASKDIDRSTKDFIDMTKAFNLYATKEGFQIPQMKSASFLASMNDTLIGKYYNEMTVGETKRDDERYIYLPQIQVKGHIELFNQYSDFVNQPSYLDDLFKPPDTKGNRVGTIPTKVFPLGGSYGDTRTEKDSLEIRILSADFEEAKDVGLINHTDLPLFNEPMVVVAEIPKSEDV
jgi:hypothetical protein